MPETGLTLTESRRQEAKRIMGLGFLLFFDFSVWRGKVRIPGGASCSLVPKGTLKRMLALKQRAYRNIQRYSYDTRWGRFLPFKAYRRWLSEDDEIRSSGLAEWGAFVAMYDKIPESVRLAIKHQVADLYRKASNGDGDPPLAFSEGILSSVLGKLPEKRELAKLYLHRRALLAFPVPGQSFKAGEWPIDDRWLDTACDGVSLLSRDVSDLDACVDFERSIRSQFGDKLNEWMSSYLSGDAKCMLVDSWQQAAASKLDDIESVDMAEDGCISAICSGCRKAILNKDWNDYIEKLEGLLAAANERKFSD